MNAIQGEGAPIEVLLVEDSPGDVRLTREALRDANRAIHLSVACDGVEAMAFLRQEGAYVDPGSRVERGHRLVEQQHLRLEGERPGQRDPL